MSDLHATQRGDVRLSYRLNIRPERPDFRLIVLPDSPNLPDALTLSSGGRSLAYAVALREDGFSNAIRVEAAELPPGVTCEPVLIPAGQAMTPIVFESAPGSKPIVGMVKLVGRSRFGDRKEDLGYHSGATPLGPDLAHQALGATVIWPSPDVPPQQPAQGPTGVTRLTRGVVMKVVEALPLSLEVSPRLQAVSPGSLITLDLAVKRSEPFTEAVTVTAVSTYPNMGNPAPSVAIPKGQTSGSFAFRLPLTLSPGVYSIVLQGAGAFPFSKDPKAKTKPAVGLVMPSNPITLVVRPAPLSLIVKPAVVSLKAGAKVEVEVSVNRKDGGKDPIEIQLAAPTALKLKAESVRAESGKAAKLVVISAADSPPGPALGVAVRATVLVNGEPVDVNEPLTLTITK